MAKITFGLDELNGILRENGLIPPQILRVKTKGQTLHFAVKTGSFILPFVPASLSFSEFDGNNAIFELNVVSGRLKKANSWFNDLLRPKLPDCVEIDYPKVSIDINRLLSEKGIRGLRVKDMFFEDDNFAVITDSG